LPQLKMRVGTMLFTAALFAGWPARGQTYTVLHQFGVDIGPLNALTIGRDGYFYGSSVSGGGGSCPHTGILPPYGCGMIFKMDPVGNITVLHSFIGWLSQPNDGAGPSPLILATDGYFYGTTGGGGASINCLDGCGTVFRMDTSGQVTTLHNFDLNDGRGGSRLTLATDGNLYGMTDIVGTNHSGAIYRMDPSGNLTILHSFSGSSDGAGPSSLVQANDGFLYGTTASGGSGGCFGLGCGTFFKMDLSGNLITLHAFTGYPSDGAYPSAVIQAVDGDFYGTTSAGGGGHCQTFQLNYVGCGTVFKMDSTGNLTTLYSFAGGQDGTSPLSLIQGTDRNYYGTAYAGGAGDCEGNGCGVDFKLDPTGNFSVLYSFTPPDGAHPISEVVQASDGNLYGTTSSSGGGNYPAGAVIYRLSPSRAACIPDVNTLCLDNGRFQVQAQWSYLNVYGGVASVVPGVSSNNSGVMWFFGPDNWELLIKVLNGCAVNGHYWVFGAAATNVQYTIQVTDTQTGEVRAYTNPPGMVSTAITDTAAFTACP
jgi:uncharacterized repeat protein (TIGR03803 family)